MKKTIEMLLLILVKSLVRKEKYDNEQVLKAYQDIMQPHFNALNHPKLPRNHLATPEEPPKTP